MQVICRISNECETQHELPPIIVSFPPLISISFNSFIVYISFAQILFCFRVTLQSYFPLIDFLHFILFVSLTYMIFTELSVYLFTSMNQDLYTSLTKTSSYTTFRNDRKILAYKLSLRFCL